MSIFKMICMFLIPQGFRDDFRNAMKNRQERIEELDKKLFPMRANGSVV